MLYNKEESEGRLGMGPSTDRKATKADNVISNLRELESLSYKVREEMAHKKEFYFGITPEKISADDTAKRHDPDGFFDSVERIGANIERNLMDISDMLNSF